MKKPSKKQNPGSRPRRVSPDADNAEAVEMFNRALAIKLQWGPEAAVDARLRIAEALPAISARRIDALLKEFGPIISRAHAAVYEQVEQHGSEEDGRRAVAAIDLRLSPDNAATLYQQARYSAWRDGLT